MRSLIALLFVLSLGSCTAIDTLKKVAEQTGEFVEQGREVVTAVREVVKEGRAFYAEHKTKADTDGDGKTTFQEWWVYLLALGGIGVGEARRRGGIRVATSDALKHNTAAAVRKAEERLDALERGS